MGSYRMLKSRLGPYLLGVILAFGATVAWALAVSLLYFPVVLVAFNSAGPVREWLTFTLDGEPLLVTSEPSLLPVVTKVRLPNGKVRTTTSNQLETYRTLNGQTLEIPAMQLYGNNRPLPGPAPRVWRRMGPQIRGFLSSTEHPEYWYGVFRDDAAGHAYFVGFDPITRRPIGYLTTTGFQLTPLTADEQFAVDAWLRSEQADVAADSTTYGKYYLVSAGALYAIGFLPPSVQLLPMPEPVVAVGKTDIPQVNEKGDDVYNQGKLVARLPEELVVLNHDESTWRRVPIPPQARDRAILLHGTLMPDMILETYDQWPSPREIYWIDPEGAVVRQATVELSQPSSGRSPWDALFPAVVLPAPWMLAYTIGRDSAAREAISFEQWLSFAAVGLISLALAIACFRRQRAISRGGAALWAVLVFWLGPPGYVGYLTHRRWPARESCQQCGAVVPRDRETCLACAAEFPPPAPLGIEIFA